MKRLLVVGLLSLVALTACADSGATVCVIEVMGEETRTTIYEENGYVTSVTTESSTNVSDMSADEIRTAIEVTQAAMGEIVDIEHVGDYIVTSMTVTAEDLEDATLLDELVADLEADGSTCN